MNGMDYVEQYYRDVTALMERIRTGEAEHMRAAADLIAEQVAQDRLVTIWGPGGHSNLAAMEVFFRAGGLMHFNAILDEGTLLSDGALRSMQMERLPGYGSTIIGTYDIGPEDLVVVVNAYGINSACIDAALESKRRGATVIGVSSVQHAENTPEDHVARHPSKQNLHDVVDCHVDTRVPVGDAVVSIEGITQNIGAVSTFANAFTLQSIVILAVEKLAGRGIEPPIWKSGNASGGDAWNNQFMDRFKGKIRYL